MSYRGFQSYRHFLNTKLHALAVQIVGQEQAKDFLREHVIKIFQSRESVSSGMMKRPADDDRTGIMELIDREAQGLYRELVGVCQKVKANLKTSKQLTGTDDSMTPGQRKAIIKLTKYDFQWSPEASFSFILGLFPDKRKRLSPWEIQNSKLQKLFSMLNKKESDKIIKHLDKIKQRNLKDG